MLPTTNPDPDAPGIAIDVQMEAPAAPAKLYQLELSEQEWKENHQMGAFSGLEISYTMEDGKYKIDFTLEQYQKYQKNCGELEG